MRVTVVGRAPAWTRQPGEASSCYLVEHDRKAVVLDMGQGSFAGLSHYRDPASVDALLVSHLHPDHMVDLVPLRHYLKYGAPGAPAPALHGPSELRARFAAFTGEPGFLDGLPGHPLRPGRFELAGISVETRHVTHIPDSYGFRLAPSKGADRPGLVYSGDCAEPDDLLPLTRAGDTLLCEAFYGADERGGPLHLTAQQAARVAAEAGAARLVLTHIGERHRSDVRDVAAQIFSGELMIARPGLQIELGE